jgi:malate dehydrogenase (oxaloacetate-decarboxylating)(NADP+)
MKMAVKALALLAKNLSNMETKLNFVEIIIPKPSTLDYRMKAAMESGVALNPITDWVKYEELLGRLGMKWFD